MRKKSNHNKLLILKCWQVSQTPHYPKRKHNYVYYLTTDTDIKTLPFVFLAISSLIFSSCEGSLVILTFYTLKRKIILPSSMIDQTILYHY